MDLLTIRIFATKKTTTTTTITPIRLMCDPMFLLFICSCCYIDGNHFFFFFRQFIWYFFLLLFQSVIFQHTHTHSEEWKENHFLRLYWFKFSIFLISHSLFLCMFSTYFCFLVRNRPSSSTTIIINQHDSIRNFQSKLVTTVIFVFLFVCLS